MNIHEVMRILGITQQTVYQHIRANNLNPVKKGRSWEFDGREVYAFLRKRNISKARASPTNIPRDHVVGGRQFSPEAIRPLAEKLSRFQTRYEQRSEYQPLFDFKYMVFSTFYYALENDEPFTGADVNEVLAEIDMHLREDLFENKQAWEILREGFEEAFRNTNDDFNRSDIYEDLILDAAIELST